MQSDSGLFYCSEPTGRVHANRVHAEKWERYSLVEYKKIRDSELLSVERLFLGAINLHLEGRSQEALHALAAIEESQLPLQYAWEFRRRINCLRAQIQILGGALAELEKIASFTDILAVHSELIALAFERAVQDGIAPDKTLIKHEGGRGPNGGAREGSGLQRIACLKEGDFADSHVERFLKKANRNRTLSLSRQVWPELGGGVVDNARVIGHDWVVYVPKVGAFLRSEHHHHYHVKYAQCSKQTVVITSGKPNEKLLE